VPPTGGQPTADQRNWAIGAHLSAILAAFVALAFLGPLIIWLVKRESDAFVAHHAVEALNFQITWLGVLVVTFVIGIATLGIGFLLFLIIGPLWLYLVIRGAMAASRGDGYRYPLTVRLFT
jgi:hypothetical protein